MERIKWCCKFLILVASFLSLFRASAGAQSLSPSATELFFNVHDIGTTTTPQSVTFTNISQKVVKIKDLPIKDAAKEGFQLSTDCPDSLNPGQHCAITAVFNPFKKGKHAFPLGLTDDVTLKLSGEGYPALISSQDSLAFEPQTVGTMSPVHSLKLTNHLGSTVKITSVVGSENFANVSSDCVTLDDESSCTVNVGFAPKYAGSLTGKLAVNYEGEAADSQIPATSKVIQLSGLASPNVLWRQRVWAVHRQGLVAFGVCLFYFLGLLVTRWHMVAKPARNELHARIGSLRSRIKVEPNLLDKTNATTLTDLLEEADKPLTRFSVLDFLFWTRGQESAAWAMAHEVEFQLARRMPLEPTRASMEVAEQTLRQNGFPVALALADKISKALDSVPPALWQYCRALLEDVDRLLKSEAAALAGALESASTPAPAPPDLSTLQDRVQQFLKRVKTIKEQLKKDAGFPDEWKGVLPEAMATLDLLEGCATNIQKILNSEVDPKLALTDIKNKTALLRAKDLVTKEVEASTGLAQKIEGLRAAIPPYLDRWRALLFEAVVFNYGCQDTRYNNLSAWQDKAMWLVGCGILLIITLTATLPNGIFFAVGAAAGFLSRLMRELNQDDVPSDYGASWSTLFLSPVVGAICGWAGVLAIVALEKLNILGTALTLKWEAPYEPAALGLAFALGFAEALFNKVLDNIGEGLFAASTSSTTVKPAPLKITPTQLKEGKVNQDYRVLNMKLEASGGTPPYSWSVTSGDLPKDLRLDAASGLITGVPKAATPVGNPVKFTVLVSDKAKGTASQEFNIAIAAP